MILDLNDIQKKEESSNISVDLGVAPVSSNIPPLNTGVVKGQVIKKVIFTTTEILIYPNGSVFPGKTRTWLQNAVYKPKQKKKAAPLKKVKVAREEVY